MTESSASPSSGPTPKKKVWRTVSAIAAAILAVGLVLGAGFVIHLNQVMNDVERAHLIPEPEKVVKPTATPQPSVEIPVLVGKPTTTTDANGNVTTITPTITPTPSTAPDGSTQLVVPQDPITIETTAPDGSKTKVRVTPTANPQETQQGAPIRQYGSGEYALRQHSNPPEVTQPTKVNDGSLNYLIVGSDSRTDDVADGRSDVILVAHISGDRKRVDLIHIPRDYYVNIPGYGYNKINASYAQGGVPLLIKTVQPLIGVTIDHVALIGFDGFKDMTTQVGGVDVYVKETSPRFPNVGFTHVEGDEALWFVRERKTLQLGDISRGQRQEELVRALLVKATSSSVITNPVTFNNFVQSVANNTIVDDRLSNDEIRSTALSMRGIQRDDIKSHTAPNHWTRMDPYAGSVVVVDYDKLAKLREALRNDTMSSYPW